MTKRGKQDGCLPSRSVRLVGPKASLNQGQLVENWAATCSWYQTGHSAKNGTLHLRQVYLMLYWVDTHLAT